MRCPPSNRGIGKRFINPILIEIYAIIVKKGIKPNFATSPEIFAILIGPPNWSMSAFPLKAETTKSQLA